MSSIIETAKAYESKKTKNIADLKEVDGTCNVFEGEGNDKDGKPFKYKYIEVNGEQYRMPDTVFKDLKAILERKPNLTKFCVNKKGEGFATEYTVIPLD